MSGPQSEALMAAEGDAWLSRNRDKLGLSDPVSDIITMCGIEPKSVLEIGCANGWRLAKMRERYGCSVAGIDPSAQAVDETMRRGIAVARGEASCLPFDNGKFDLVIAGFFLYLADRSDLFRIVAESDRVLQDRGHIVIHDFDASKPCAAPYKHRPGLRSYHMDYPALWAANPAYQYVDELSDGDGSTATILHKNVAGAWPMRSS